jgi:hypothetical protein
MDSKSQLVDCIPLRVWHWANRKIQRVPIGSKSILLEIIDVVSLQTRSFAGTVIVSELGTEFVLFRTTKFVK